MTDIHTCQQVGTENSIGGVVSPSTMHSSAFSTSWCTESVALYGSTTVSETFGDGTTEKVIIILSGYLRSDKHSVAVSLVKCCGCCQLAWLVAFGKLPMASSRQADNNQKAHMIHEIQLLKAQTAASEPSVHRGSAEQASKQLSALFTNFAD